MEWFAAPIHIITMTVSGNSCETDLLPLILPLTQSGFDLGNRRNKFLVDRAFFISGGAQCQKKIL